jgi:hypothetical protein
MEIAMSQMSVAKRFQFSALTIASGAAGWTAYLVPNWKFGNDPCLWAAVATVIIVAILWKLFWLPVLAPRSERRVLAGFLVGMPIIYLMRCLFFADHALTASWLWIELLGLIVFCGDCDTRLERGWMVSAIWDCRSWHRVRSLAL